MSFVEPAFDGDSVRSIRDPAGCERSGGTVPRALAGVLLSTEHAPRILVLLGTLVAGVPAFADDPQAVAVRHPEGLVHGFLVMRTLDGAALASGDLIQNVSGDRVTSRLVFAFRDGSVHDETAVFAQQRQFRLIKYQLVQKGPAFPRALNVSLDGGSGKTTVRYTDDGEEKVETDTLKFPAGLANGMLPILLRTSAPPRRRRRWRCWRRHRSRVW